MLEGYIFFTFEELVHRQYNHELIILKLYISIYLWEIVRDRERGRDRDIDRDSERQREGVDEYCEYKCICLFTTICYLPDDYIITRFTFIHKVVQNHHPHWPWNGPHCQTLHLFLNFYLLVIPTLLGLTTYNVERIMHWIKLMVSMPVSQYSSKSGRPVHDLITQLLHYCSSMYFLKSLFTCI